MAAFLGQIGWGQVDRDVPERQPEADRMERVPDPLAAFGDGLVWQTDNCERRLAWRDANLNLNRPGLDTHERQSRNLSVHH
jgi:hypothetical protein